MLQFCDSGFLMKVGMSQIRDSGPLRVNLGDSRSNILL